MSDDEIEAAIDRILERHLELTGGEGLIKVGTITKKLRLLFPEFSTRQLNVIVYNYLSKLKHVRFWDHAYYSSSRSNTIARKLFSVTQPSVPPFGSTQKTGASEPGGSSCQHEEVIN